MRPNTVAENILGTIGTICWTIQLIPQIAKSYRDKNTKGLSPWLVFLWGVAGTFLGVYTVTQNLNIPLILQPQLFAALSFISWIQCLYYNGPLYLRHRIIRCTTLSILIMLFFGGLEVAMIFAIRPSYRRGHESAVEPFGIISSVIIAVALLPQYHAIYVHKAVIGISTTFMLVDMLGGIFSDLSLVFRPGSFDIVAGVTYSVVAVMDGLVLVAAVILNPYHAKRLKQSSGIEMQGSHERTCTSLSAGNSEHIAPVQV